MGAYNDFMEVASDEQKEIISNDKEMDTALKVLAKVQDILNEVPSIKYAALVTSITTDKHSTLVGTALNLNGPEMVTMFLADYISYSTEQHIKQRLADEKADLEMLKDIISDEINDLKKDESEVK